MKGLISEPRLLEFLISFGLRPTRVPNTSLRSQLAFCFKKSVFNTRKCRENTEMQLLCVLQAQEPEGKEKGPQSCDLNFSRGQVRDSESWFMIVDPGLDLNPCHCCRFPLEDNG